MFLDGFGPQILAGTLVTLKLALGSLLGAVLIGLLGASAKLAANRPLRALASGYTTLIRSVPDLVIMLLLFFSLQILLNRVTDALGIGQVDIDPFAAGCVTLAFIYGAYFTETFRGAFQAVPAGQVEAAQAYGMGRWRVFRRVLLPQMLRYALPGIGNNWQVLVKSTALVSIIGLGDLVKATQDAGKGTLQFFHFTLVCGLIYLAITAISNAALLAVAGAAQLAGRQEAAAMNAVLDEYWQAYLWTDGLQLTGLAMTLWLLILAVALGFLLAIPLAVARTCGNPLLRYPVWLYTYVFRGTPLYIQLLFFYTGVYSLNAIRAQDFLNAFFRDGFNCTVLAFVLNTCAYMTEIFAGAIRNTPHGEVEAARAYGMGGFTLYRRIVLPSALRRALPYFSNEVILMLHSTSVAFTATVPDLLKVARDVNSATYAPFLSFGIAGALYAGTAFLLIWLFRRGELRWLAYLRPQTH